MRRLTRHMSVIRMTNRRRGGHVDLRMKHDDNSGCGLTRVDLVLLPVANHHHRHHQLVHRRQFLCRETKKNVHQSIGYQ